MGDEVVEVAGTENDKHLELVRLDVVEHLVFLNHLFLHTFLEVVVDELRGDALDGQLTGRIDFREDDLIQLTQCLSEILVEVAGTGVEVRLEDGGDVLILIQFTDALRTLVDLLRVVGIVKSKRRSTPP